MAQSLHCLMLTMTTAGHQGLHQYSDLFSEIVLMFLTHGEEGVVRTFAATGDDAGGRTAMFLKDAIRKGKLVLDDFRPKQQQLEVVKSKL